MNESYQNVIAVIEEVKKAVTGKDDCIIKAFAAILAGGHILIEDVPGVGKTTLAIAFSQAMALNDHRVQFTPDVMPADILGFYMYQKETGQFVYHPGTIMCNLFLADEINRTSPKTQSALLEVMEEGRLSVEGEVYELPKPFLVIATENPFGSAGTQRLPEAQLDRFLICLSMGYPSIEEELDIVRGKCNTIPIEDIRPVIDRAQVRELQRQVSLVHIDNKVYDYIGRLVTETRQSQEIALGLSPRGTIALAKMAQAMAYVTGRSYVIPEDVACIFSDVAAHRIRMRAAGQDGVEIRKGICRNILERVEKPAVLA